MLYKYKSLSDFKHFMDVIVNNRLWASKYYKLNDPMEGVYIYHRGQFSKKLRDKLKGQKENLRICSLTHLENYPLMWSHYADGDKGVAIGISIDEKSYPIHPIEYVDTMELDAETYGKETAEEILTKKLKCWEYEEESRIFVHGKCFVENIKIHRIICGSKMDRKTDFPLIKRIVNNINPAIEIFQKSKIIDD